MTDRTAFETRLRRFSRARRGLLNAVLSYRLGVLALGAGVVGLLLLSGWLPGVLVNLGLFALLVLWLFVLCVLWLVQRVRFRGCLDEAFQLEELAGTLNSRVISAWDFLHEIQPTPLQQAVIARAGDDLKAQHEARLDRRERDQRRLWFVVGLFLFVAIGLTPPFGFARMFGNFGKSWRGLQDMLFPVELTVEVNPREPAYRLGTKVEVALQVNRKINGEARLVRKIGDETKFIPLSLGEDNSVKVVVTSDVEAEQVLRFEIGGRESEEVTLIFTTPPVLVNMQTELVYPAYTRQPPRSLESVQQRLLALPGTRITLGFTFSKELESATVTWDDGSALPLEVVGRYATVSLLHGKAHKGSLQVRDKHSFPLDEPLTVEFEEQIDEKPQVLLPRHLKEDMPMLEPAAKLFGFGVQASDDYGVTRVVLRWQKSSVENPNGVTDRGEVERLISPPQPRAVVSFEKVFEGMNLKPGDRISFVAEVQDNRAPQKQTTVSRRCSFFVFQENLGDLTVRELGFGGLDPLARERIARSTRATTVKEPEGLKSREGVKNEFEANVTSGTQAPAVRGEHAQATRDYFRLLSTVKYPEADPRKP
jgi:hypothetical protein